MNKVKKGDVRAQLRLDDIDDERRDVAIVVHTVDETGTTTSTSEVDRDGAFTVSRKTVAEAHRVVIAASEADPNDRASTIVMRPNRFLDEIDLGDVALGRPDWSRLFLIRRCVDARVRRCFPTWQVIQPLLPPLPALPATPALPDLDVFGPPVVPLFRCAPICEGVVEVYRRTCCCRPPVLVPPDFDPRPPSPIPDPDPDPIPDPFPGPDPVPFDVLNSVVTEGTLDVAKHDAARDRLALAELTGVARRDFIVARPYLWCTCGPGVKVGQGFVRENGRVHVCWTEPLRLLPLNCRDQYSFVVKQNIAGNTVTIYNGPAAGRWFDAGDDDIDLTSYHPFAIGCRDDGFPADPGGAYVVLQDIGNTESHQLNTPEQDGPDSVGALGPDSGLLAVGALDYALGGTLRLRYHFSDDMQTIGARYYRVQIASANSSGDPVGSWETVPAPTWDTWRVVGTTIERGAHALGPNVVGDEFDLFDIPFDTGGLLSGSEEWQGGQYHAVLDSTQRAAGHYLLRIEVFDAAGNRLEPGSDPFSYRRWINTTDTLPVPHGALTHALRTDNRPVVGDIVDVTGPGIAAGDCKFFAGSRSDEIEVQLQAFHPQPGAPSFMDDWRLTVRRGINGGDAVTPVNSTAEVGEGGLASVVKLLIDDLLDGEPKCSFTADLHVRARIHNGYSRVSGYDRRDQASFAVEAVETAGAVEAMA